MSNLTYAQKLHLFETGGYHKFTPPPVEVEIDDWIEADWIAWIDNNGDWTPKDDAWEQAAIAQAKILAFGQTKILPPIPQIRMETLRALLVAAENVLEQVQHRYYDKEHDRLREAIDDVETAIKACAMGTDKAKGYTSEREYFSAVAMQGILSAESEEYGYGEDYQQVAALAVKAADALIAELESRQ